MLREEFLGLMGLNGREIDIKIQYLIFAIVGHHCDLSFIWGDRQFSIRFVYED